MLGSCCSCLMFFAFTSLCRFQFFLTDGASNMQILCSIFKVLEFLPVVFCGLGA